MPATAHRGSMLVCIGECFRFTHLMPTSAQSCVSARAMSLRVGENHGRAPAERRMPGSDGTTGSVRTYRWAHAMNLPLPLVDASAPAGACATCCICTRRSMRATGRSWVRRLHISGSEISFHTCHKDFLGNVVRRRSPRLTHTDTLMSEKRRACIAQHALRRPCRDVLTSEIQCGVMACSIGTCVWASFKHLPHGCHFHGACALGRQ